MISVVMFGHALLPYMTVPRDFKDPAASIGFDVVGIFLYSFAMQAFFLTAGFTSAVVFDRRGAAGLLRNRWQRILLPFLVAWALIAPLTRAAHQFARETAGTLSIHAGIERLLEFRWLDWGKIYHLWFLPALVLFTLLALAGLLAGRGLPDGLRAKIVRVTRAALRSRWRAAILTLVILPVVVPAYIAPDGGLEGTLSGIALFIFFVVGWALYTQRDLLPAFGREAAALIAIALLALPATVWATRERLFTQPDHDLLAGIVAGAGNALLAACMALGLLGLFQGRLDAASARWRYVSDASYWIYLIHMPFVIFGAAALSVTPWPAILKYLATVGVVLPVVIATYHFGLLKSPLRRVLTGAGRERQEHARPGAAP